MSTSTKPRRNRLASFKFPSSASHHSNVSTTSDRPPRSGFEIPNPADMMPPTPPPKDSPTRSPITSDLGHERILSDTSSVFTVRPGYLSRAGSVYSLSRESLSSHISQLKSVQLPNPAELKESLRNIDSAPKLVNVLDESSELILKWMKQASRVLDGLDSGDDVEWAAAGGREGLDEVESALDFESLIQIYIDFVEGLQKRRDISDIATDQMKNLVGNLEVVVSKWQGVKEGLSRLKKQVELAMEWQELRDSLFSDIASRLEDLSRAVFEMEEQRHMSNQTNAETFEEATNVDLLDMHSINEEAKNLSKTIPSLHNMGKTSTQLPHPTLSTEGPSEDDQLLELYARMQPLKASIDFLPMRVNLFKTKGNSIFPSACRDLEISRENFEQEYATLESDAETLRKELAEDRWVKVFKNASKQALKMMDSIQRSVTKLDESLDSNTKLRHAPGTVKKIEHYEAKKRHYVAALKQVMAIIERGAKERHTVNGELVRLQEYVQRRWKTLIADMETLDSTLAYFQSTEDQEVLERVRAEVAIPSIETSPGPAADTASQSSPASSVYTPSRRQSSVEHVTPIPIQMLRHISPETVHTPLSSNRHSSIPIRSPKSSFDLSPATTTSPSIRRTASPQVSESSMTSSNRHSKLPVNYQSPYRQSPTANAKYPRQSFTPSPSMTSRPRWNTSTRVDVVPIEGAYRGPSQTPSPLTAAKVHASRPQSRVSSAVRKPSPLGLASVKSVDSLKPATPVAQKRRSIGYGGLEAGSAPRATSRAGHLSSARSVTQPALTSSRLTSARPDTAGSAQSAGSGRRM